MNQEADNHDLKAATAHILSIMQAHKGELLSKPNVVGVAMGYRQTSGLPTETLALVVMVTHKVPQSALSPEDQIPSSLEGIPIDVQEVGEISAH
ncbi:MAG: hypothetical protein V3U36_03180 [Anaerolineales bacterium]|jgi:hypothetical protein